MNICSLCEPDDSVCHCQEYGNYLCSKCRRTHRRMRTTKGHAVRDVGAREEWVPTKGGLVREEEEPSRGETQEKNGLAAGPKPQGYLPSNIDSEALGPGDGRMLRKLLRASTDTLAASNDLGKATRQLALCTHAMVCTCKKTDPCILNSRGGNYCSRSPPQSSS